MDEDDPHETAPDDDSLLREIAAAPPLAIPQDLATFVLLEPGTVVDGVFRIESRLGAGGMGVVYAARDLKLDREVALKLMRLDRGPTPLAAKLPDVFEREARATARLNHPNVVTLHQFGNWNGLLYLVLERLRGETLHARMERSAVSLADGVAIMELVARALVHTHAAGITHRDLKPQNVFLLADGAVKVLDFGVSGLGRIAETPRAVGAPRDRSTLSLAGTPGYMAPEQWDGAPQDARTDIFAVGVMLYQLATGELPFASRPVDVGEVAPSLAGKVPEEAVDLVALVASCLATRREQRLGDASELAERLHAIAGALRGSASASMPAKGGALATARVRPRKRVRNVTALAAVGVAGTAMVVAALGIGGRHADHCAATQRLAGVWDASVRARLEAKFRDSPAWSATSRALDGYVDQWTPLYEAACRGGRAPVQACLDDRLAALRRYTGEAATMTAPVALAAARGLPALAECSDPDYLDSLAHPEQPAPRDPKALVPFALSIAGRGRDIVHGLAFVDGELVVVGFASDNATVAGKVLHAPKGSEERFGFVARIGHDGVARWVTILDKAAPLGVTAHGDAIAIGGAYNHGATIGSTELALPSNPKADAGEGFIARLDAATGALVWWKGLGASSMGKVHAVANDGDGNFYAAGDYGGHATFGGTAEVDAGDASESAPFIASWSPDGVLRWVDAGHATSISKTWSLAVADDSVVFASYIRGAGRLGDRPFGEGGCLIGRLERGTGAIAWLHQERGGDSRCVADAIAVRGDRVAVSGRRIFSTNGAWVAELALADGATRWVRSVGVAEHDSVKALAFAPDGALYAAGHFTTDTLALDGRTLISNGSWDGFVARFDAAGHTTGSVDFGGPTSDLARCMAVGPEGELVVGGRFETALRVGDRTLRGRSTYDGYVVEISPALLTTPLPRAGAASP